MNGPDAFRRTTSPPPQGFDGRSMAVSLGVHAGAVLLLVLAGALEGTRRPPLMTGGGSSLSVEMVVLDQLSDRGPIPGEAEAHSREEQVSPPVEESVQVQETLEPPEPAEVEEVHEQVREPVQEPVQEQVETGTDPAGAAEQTGDGGFIAVGASGEAGAGAPGPASYEGRVFAAIRRNFVTSMTPSQTYRIHFTVNTDGTHRYEVVRRSGNQAFDRAVEHALETASIPPMPPGRTVPATLSIEFMGP